MPSSGPTKEQLLYRPAKTFKEFWDPNSWPYLKDMEIMLETEEFLKLIKKLYGAEVPRRTLQLYSSPRFKLLPSPVHKGGHVSYYLNPEHTQRLGVILHMRDKLFFPLDLIGKVLQSYPVEHYDLILNRVLAGSELMDFPALIARGFSLKDVVFYKIAKLLMASGKAYGELFVVAENPNYSGDIDQEINQTLHGDVEEFERWIKTGRREDMDKIVPAR